MITLNVNSLENAEIFWRELGLENEVALNEAFDSPLQTVALPLDIIDDVFDKIEELKLEHSPIAPATAGKYMFSFVAPEGNTFVVVGDWVRKPYEAADREEFFENIKNVRPISVNLLAQSLTQNAFVLFGRVTCPWTRHFVKQLPNLDLGNKPIYYIDTENTELDSELAAVRKAYGVVTVPAFLKRLPDGSIVKFDQGAESLADFVK